MSAGILDRDGLLAQLSGGAHIQPDRLGALVITIEGRCADDWEDLRREGWLSKTISGTYVLSDRGKSALAISDAFK